MPPRREFTAFFSYACQDAQADPLLIEALTNQLETRVNVRLVNDRFSIWRDKEDIRTGDKWDSKIQSVISTSDIFIVLLTPKWLGSLYCQKEYTMFEDVEAARSVGDYTAGFVAPILARDLERQIATLTDDQKAIHDRIRSRSTGERLSKDAEIGASGSPGSACR
jgi:hypothetical protein